MTTPIDPPATPPRYLLSQQPAPQRPNSSNPVDPARLPVLTEVLVLESAAVPVNVPVLTQTLQMATPLVAALPETAISNQLAAASLAFLPSNVAASNAPISGAAAAIAAVAAQPSLPVASLADLARPLPPPGSIPLLPPWVHKVVTDAIDEAIAQAMPQLLSDITGHVRLRLTEAARNPNRNLF